jgi:hypothetical protein
MATLETGRSQLQQIERSRQLAAALQQMATSFGPVVHPYQGLAKLAQAYVGVVANKAADSREKELAEERSKALAEALSPVTVPGGQLPSSQANIGGIPEQISIPGRRGPGGQQEAPTNMMLEGIPDKANIPGMKYGSYERPRSLSEMLSLLPAEYGESVLSDVAKQQLLANAGLTPQQLAARNPGDLYASVGTRTVTMPGQEPFEAELFREKAAPGRVGLLDATGQMRPLDTSWISGAVDVTSEKPWSVNERSDFQSTATEAITAFDQIDRLRKNIPLGGLTQKTAVGMVSAFFDNAASTLDQIGLRLNRENEGVLIDAGAYKSLDVTDEDRDKYSSARISEIQSGWKRFSVLDAANQQIAISLAYTLARIADPGGRLSEMDVMNQMLALGLDQPSPERRLSALNEAERTFAKTVETRLWFARNAPGNENLAVPPVLERKLQSVLGGGGQNVISTATGDINIDPAKMPLYTHYINAPPDVQDRLWKEFPTILQEFRARGLIE